MDSIADEAVVATNDDAAICKYQASLKGYYMDPFVDLFLSSKVKTSMPRKAPEINRGYYARSTTIAYVVEQFINSHPDGQIINLGAGYDTLFWRLNSKDLITKPTSNEDGDTDRGKDITYVEVDMSSVVIHKIMAIRRHSELNKVLKNIRYKGEGLHSTNYHLLSFDLRQVDKTPFKLRLIDDCKLNIEKPTLCLTECVLVYMPTQDSRSLIGWLSETFARNLTIVNYEQCNMSDRFGEIMMANMNERHCCLMGVDACQSIDSQMERFKSQGLTEARGWTLLEILKHHLLPSSVERVNAIEFLDEQELLEQLLEHYCVVIGSNCSLNWLPKQEYWLSVTTA